MLEIHTLLTMLERSKLPSPPRPACPSALPCSADPSDVFSRPSVPLPSPQSLLLQLLTIPVYVSTMPSSRTCFMRVNRCASASAIFTFRREKIEEEKTAEKKVPLKSVVTKWCLKFTSPELQGGPWLCAGQISPMRRHHRYIFDLWLLITLGMVTYYRALANCHPIISMISTPLLP